MTFLGNLHLDFLRFVKGSGKSSFSVTGSRFVVGSGKFSPPTTGSQVSACPVSGSQNLPNTCKKLPESFCDPSRFR